MAVELEAFLGRGPEMSMRWHPVRWPHAPAQQSSAGRRAAAAALAVVGSVDLVVPRESDGRPRFPQGFAGSISHTDHVAVAVVVPGAGAVGVDIQAAMIGPRVSRFVLRERERRMLLGAYSPRELFAAKEAAFKAISGAGEHGHLLFWQIDLDPADDALIASYRGATVPVWVGSAADLSFALAIRR